MSLSKIVLIIVGIVAVVMGVLVYLQWPVAGFVEPVWHTWAKIVIGLVCIVIPFIDKK
jgi:hypothetical protein